MIARTPEEFELFEKIDAERMAEQAGQHPLMQEDELPEYLWLDRFFIFLNYFTYF